MTDIQDRLADMMEQVKWHGDYFSAICPFPHNGRLESHGSLLVYPDGFCCMGCSRTGNLAYLMKAVNKHHHSGLVQINREPPPILPRWYKWGKKYGDIDRIAEIAHAFLTKIDGHKVFFKHRKIDQFIEQGYFGYLEGWIMFPVFDEDHDIIDIVVRSSKKGGVKYVLMPDASRVKPNVYVPNWERVKTSDTVYVPYGIIDAWAFEAIGLPALTGTTGKSLSPDHLLKLGKRVVIVPDQFEEPEAYRLANEIGIFSSVKRVNWPDGTKDCDDIRRVYGNDALRDILSSL